MIDEEFLSEKCIHCGKCTRNCAFLKKYGIDLNGFEKRKDLAYHCFLCDKCRRVCPVGIDGVAIAMKNRKDAIESGSKIEKSLSFKPIILEKRNYPFKNYKNVKGSSTVLFTGCNMLSYLPVTTKVVIEKMAEYGIGTVFDCCSKPVLDMGMENEFRSSVERLNHRLVSNGIEEVVLMCPNCYYLFVEHSEKFDVKFTDIFTKLCELGFSANNCDVQEGAFLFRPCPDRKDMTLFRAISGLFPLERLNSIDEQCCGAGGMASILEGDTADVMKSDVKRQVKESMVYTYCSTCTSFLKQKGVNTKHILSALFGVDEPDFGNSLMNRARFRFYR